MVEKVFVETTIVGDEVTDEEVGFVCELATSLDEDWLVRIAEKTDVLGEVDFEIEVELKDNFFQLKKQKLKSTSQYCLILCKQIQHISS